MGRSKKAYSLLKPNGQTPYFRVRWRYTKWRSTQTLGTADEAEAARRAARLYEEKLTGKRNLTLSAYAKDFFVWEKCLWLTKRTEEGAIVSKKIASQHRATILFHILVLGLYSLASFCCIISLHLEAVTGECQLVRTGLQNRR
jgi:hypothetical protein